MDRRPEDEARLLRSTRTSEDDLEGLGAQDADNPGPYVSIVDGADDSTRSTSFPDYKRRDRYILRSPIPNFRKSCFSLKYAAYTLGILTVLLMAFVLGASFSPRGNMVTTGRMPRTSRTFVKPKGPKIVGLIFYGRPRYVSILDCYLKRNLAVNGGFLDEVHWMANTDNEFDLKYLNDLVQSVEPYKKFSIAELGYANSWAHAKAKDTLYIKIDDDMVYIHDDTIPRLVQTSLRYPEAFDVAANIINSPITNWFHHRTDAVHPYLPETKPPPNFNATEERTTWRPSELPLYDEPAADEFDFGEKRDGQDHFDVGQVGGPPYQNHRWLPLPRSSENLLKTPIAHSDYGPFGRAWTSWAMGAQQQYSLFDNLEKDQMDRYWFGDEDGIWNMQYDRYNLNFLAIWGRDASLETASANDEQEYTVDFPKKYKRPLLIDTHAIVSHFSFGPQKHEIMATDLLDRYRAYANEMICAADNQLTAMD